MHFDLDYERHPIVIWEVTKACSLACQHCPIGADASRSPMELSTYEGYKTIDQIASVDPSRFVISGGDPLEREDIYQFVEYARRRGLDPMLALSPTPSVSQRSISKLGYAGLQRIIVSLDDHDSMRHDAGSGLAGSFGVTLAALHWANEANIKAEVNTLVSRRNAAHLGGILELLETLRITSWNLYFLVPVGGSSANDMLAPEEAERVFSFIDGAASKVDIRIFEAPHYRRYRMQQVLADRQRHLDRMLESDDWADFSGYTSDEREPLASHDARGIIFISHSGEVRPSDFLPISAGNIRYRSLGSIFRGGDLFVALREPSNLKGKCGRCEFARVCGGSRARAYAVSSDLFASDPLCGYQPGTLLGH